MRPMIASLALGLFFATSGSLGPSPSSIWARAQIEEGEVTPNTRTWYAWVDRMPPGPPAFHLTGVVELPHEGFDVTLAPSEPQGVNPAILMLDLKVTELEGPHPSATEARGVRYDIDPYDGGYREVSILHEGEVIAHISAITVTY